MAIELRGSGRADGTPLCITPLDSRDSPERADPAIRVETSAKGHADETPRCAYTFPAKEGENGSWFRFGDWLIRRGLISSQDLFAALHDAFICSCRFGDVLVERQVIDRQKIEEEASSYRNFVAFHQNEPLRSPEP